MWWFRKKSPKQKKQKKITEKIRERSQSVESQHFHMSRMLMERKCELISNDTVSKMWWSKTKSF